MAPFAPLSRRRMISGLGGGFGMFGLRSMFGATAENPLAPKQPHFPAKAKRVIHLFMNGGPSQVDTFDPKPLLTKYHGKPLPGRGIRRPSARPGA